MNYRHAFHAGNFADVIKHIVLVRMLTYLQEKDAPFRVIDTHAGAGLYDLTSEEAERGGEWLTGIARVMQARFSQAAIELVMPYLDIIRAFNPQRDLQTYPGSPLIARALLRPQDRLTACELEPNARKKLIEALRRDTQARVVDVDGWTALSAFVPPNERRGLVLIDPPFEAKDEFERMGNGFATAFAKWPTGSYLLWYPAKSRRATDALAQQVAATTASAASPGKCLRVEFSVAPQAADTALASTGLLIVNPPWTLADELKVILPSSKSRSARAAPAGSGSKRPNLSAWVPLLISALMRFPSAKGCALRAKNAIKVSLPA